MYYFSEKECQPCPLRERCLSRTQTRKLVYVNPRVREHRPRAIQRAMRIRKVVERRFGEAKVWHGLRRARYDGALRVATQAYLTAIVIDVKLMAR